MLLKMENFYFSLMLIFVICLELSIYITAVVAKPADQNASEGSTVKYKRAKIKRPVPENQPTIVRNAEGKLEYIYPSTQPPTVASSTISGDVRDIIFPTDDPVHPTQAQQVRFGTAAPCSIANDGQTYCVQSDSLPEIPLNDPQFKAKLSKFEYLFENDYIEPDGVVQRLDGPGEESLCTSSERVIQPKAAKNMNDQWIQIINTANYTQGFRVELCSFPDQKCSMTDSFPYIYETKCVQKYIYRSVLAMREDLTPYKEKVKLPSCCKCILRTITDDGHRRNPSPSGRARTGSKREIQVTTASHQDDSTRNERLVMT